MLPPPRDALSPVQPPWTALHDGAASTSVDRTQTGDKLPKRLGPRKEESAVGPRRVRPRRRRSVVPRPPRRSAGSSGPVDARRAPPHRGKLPRLPGDL